MRPLEDAVKNGRTMPYFSVMMVAVDLGPQQIERTVFSDESRFQLCPDDHRRRVWRRPGQRADPAFTIAHHTGSQPGVLVWGAISFDSRTPLYPGLIFQQDNARPQTARVSMNCLAAYRTLPWPARSLSNRACLGYDEKATASTREC
ncbi:transposable element Tc1 transposase [Trichonephila clavipes]|nr:transposable element Tc1 transposase [Trichonephila clavipes]